MPLNIDYDKCCWKNGKCEKYSCGEECSGCVEVCPVQALSREQKLEIDQEKCIMCGACVAICDHDALSLT